MRSKETVSNESFGYLFSILFFLASIYFWWRLDRPAWSLTFLSASVVLLLAVRLAPWVISPANKGWMALGRLLERIVSPITLGLIFFVLITPTAIFLRIVGRDVLRLKALKSGSYWIKREPPGPAPDSFKNQF
jgi:Saxitoxin biosynthesis operon protein SxtJ